MHYLTQAAEGGLGAKKACNWSNSALIDVKNPPSSWFEKQCLREMLQDHGGVFFSFFFFPPLSLCFFISLLKMPALRCNHSSPAVNALWGQTGEKINKVNKSAM